MLDRNNVVKKNRRTVILLSVVVLISWCIFTLFLCYAFLLLLHAKFGEDTASKTAANSRDFEEIIRDTVRSIINEENQKIKREKCANLVVSNNEDEPIRCELNLSSNFDQTSESVFTTESTLPIHLKNNERTRKTDDELLRINNTSPLSRIIKRDAEAYTSSVSVPTTNSVGISNQVPKVHDERDSDEKKKNRTSVEQNSRLNHTSAKRDAVEVPIANVPLKSEKNGGRSRENFVDVEDEDDCNAELSHEQVLSPKTNLKSRKIKSDERKLCPSSRLVEETRSAEVDVVVAAHFGADSSPFKGQKQYYKQNDMVRHPTGEYREWKSNKWYSSLQMYKYVNLTDGIFVIQKAGLYFVYGQMYFTEWADINGFVISNNNETVLQCVTSFDGDKTKGSLSNTCFTGGLIKCAKGDELRIRGVHPGRLVVLEPTKSFFGMFKLNSGAWIGF